MRKVLWVHDVARRPISQFLLRPPGVFEDPAVDKFDLTPCGQQSDQTRNAI